MSTGLKPKIYVFDVDGTLTPHREPMSFAMQDALRQILPHHTCVILTGSDYVKMEAQIPDDILKLFKHVYCCVGNVLYEKGIKIKSKTFIPPIRLRQFLNDALSNSHYSIRTGAHIERREGMLNFSIVGRNASREQRKAYYEWDNVELERYMLAQDLKYQFPGIDASLGGRISIDIYPIGRDKGQAIRDLKNKYPFQNICFFGDNIKAGGNDYPVIRELKALDSSFEVLDDRDCLNYLEKMFNL
tara:strand:- start:57 stop:788 length:732 start_codon:yes stop_codon:yes gene_type:complete